MIAIALTAQMRLDNLIEHGQEEGVSEKDNYDDFLGYEAFAINLIYPEDSIPGRLFQI